MNKKKRTATSTSKFGTGGRISHDSSLFYNSRLYQDRSHLRRPVGEEHPVPDKYIDRVLCTSSEVMKELPDASVHLMITSPPYNVSKEYDENFTLPEYRDLLRSVFRETHRVLVDGGRACINVANVGRKPYIPLHAYIMQDMLDLGFLMRGEIIWNKAGSAGPSTAWGSWRSASNPTLRDVHEYILVFTKESFGRPGSGKKSTIGRDEFLELTKSIWTFGAESAKRVGHPAPFPLELPNRLIQLYSFQGDIILDPFAGSGTTCIAALRAGRHFVGYEKKKAYTTLATRRIRLARKNIE